MSKALVFKVGDRVTVTEWDIPTAILTVAKVAARIRLSDGSTWHRSVYGSTWRLYGKHRVHSRWASLRAVESGDSETIDAAAREAKEKAERGRLVSRVTGLAWSEVDALPTEALRQIVALLDAAKAGPQ